MSAAGGRLSHEDPARFLRAQRPGTRVVVRFRLPDGRASDAVGPIQRVDDTEVVIETRRGLSTIGLVDVLLAKEVPPPPR